MIFKEGLEKFKVIYKETTGKELSDKEALDKATVLLRTVELVYKPITVEQYKRLQIRRAETGRISEEELKEELKRIEDLLKNHPN